VNPEPVTNSAADAARGAAVDGEEFSDVVGPRWREPKVRRAFIGLVFVIGIFVIAPVVAMLTVAS